MITGQYSPQAMLPTPCHSANKVSADQLNSAPLFKAFFPPLQEDAHLSSFETLVQ
jgi:hypothetical protein